MRVPLLIVIASGIALAVAWVVPSLSDVLLLAGPAAVAGVILVIRALLARRASPRSILIDGSNVLYWNGGTPQIDTLRAVVGQLTERGFAPHVVFDANAGYLVAGKYQHYGAMGALLGLPEDRVIVVAKGSPADPVLLAAAREMGARIVTNDRYRDWVAAYPEVAEPGFLIRGGFTSGAVWINLEERAGISPRP